MPSTSHHFPFMNDPALQAVVQALHGEVRYVGGCVRDALLERPGSDVDMATPLPPLQVMEMLQTAKLKAVPTGLAHGTITAVSAGHAFEITTLRRDVATNGRHAEVAFTDSWEEDAARRDFTINAMSLSPQGELFDYFGGHADLRGRLVRFVGDAHKRIEEDVLRILRFYRFSAHYAAALDADGAAACVRQAALLPTLAYERVRTELLKLLQAKNPLPVWRTMLQANILHHLNLPLANVAALTRVVEVESRLKQPDALRRLFAVMDTHTTPLALAEQLRLSRTQATRLLLMQGEAPLNGETTSNQRAALGQLAYVLGREAVADRLILQQQATPDLLEYLAQWVRPAFPLTGRDLLEQGHSAGPQLGEVLKATEAWWIAASFAPDKAACLQEAQRRLAA